MSAAGRLTLGAVVYPGFELLDLFGPLEMFGNLGQAAVDIHIIAEQAGLVPAGSVADGPIGPSVEATHGFAEAPALDLILLPGGIGTFAALESAAMLDFLRERVPASTVTMSVCTGSAILARAGLLDGLPATSNKQVFDLARAQSGNVDWKENARWVDAGQVVTSSGVAAGMDMALAVIERLFGAQAATTIADGAEYTRHLDPDHDPFAAQLNRLTIPPG